MFLTKDGITIEVTHPIDIARYKKIGFKEDQASLPPAPAPKGPKTGERKVAQKVNHEPETGQS